MILTLSRQGAPRKRVSQACDRCRSRKDKCDGKKPVCSTCATNGRTCSYDANVKKRGLPEGYVRGLEKLWGLAIRDIRDVEDNLLFILGGDDEDNETILNVWNDEAQSDGLVEAWRKSQISKELERLLSNIEPNTDIGKRKRVDSDGQSAKRLGLSGSQTSTFPNIPESQTGAPRNDWPDRKLDIRRPDESQNTPTFSGLDENDQFMARDYDSILSPSYQQRAASTNTPAIVPEIPELPSETWHLLDVYFSYTHSWFPIVEKHDLLRTSYQYSQNRNVVPVSGSGAGDHAALWAAIAYAKFQHRAINNIPHAQGPVAEMVWTAERMYSQARSLIPNEEGLLELGHVQALLILTLANLGMGHFGRAWFLVGQAVRIALDLELDRPSDYILNASKSKSRAKHVFLGCFALDTIIAARLGRHPHLRSEDVDVVGFVEEDGLEEWDPWTDCLNVRRGSTSNSREPAAILSTFNRLVQVLQILNRATCISDTSKTLQISTCLLENLHVWSQAQSSPLYLDTSAMKGDQAISLLPHQYHLHTTYFTTLAMSQLLSHNYGKEVVNLEPCTRSARQIVELLNQHSNTFGLLIAPPTFEYFIKTAYDVVHAVHSSLENSHIILNDWKRTLDNCLDAMEPAWPLFESFKKSCSYKSPPQVRRESQVAFELITGMHQTADTPMSVKTPASYDTMSQYSPQVLRPQTMTRPDGTQQANITIQSTKGMTPQTSQRTPSFGASSNRGLPVNLQESPVFRNPLSADAWPMTHSQMSRMSNPSINMSRPMNPRLQHSMSIGSENAEGDPMFNEFAALDAMEWYSLVSLKLPLLTSLQDGKLGSKSCKPRLYRSRQHEPRFLYNEPRPRSPIPEQRLPAVSGEFQCGDHGFLRWFCVWWDGNEWLWRNGLWR